MKVGDRVKILTCPGHVWRGDVGTVIGVFEGSAIVRKDGDPDGMLPIWDDAEHFEPLPTGDER